MHTDKMMTTPLSPLGLLLFYPRFSVFLSLSNVMSKYIVSTQKGQGKGPGTCYSTAYMSHHNQKYFFFLSEVEMIGMNQCRCSSLPMTTIGPLGPDYKKILQVSYDVIITYNNRKSNLR